DVVTRYAHQTGHYVERRFGWDCHGLPVEHEIDKKLGIKSVDDVMKMGIKAYNAECRSIVMRYSGEWEIAVKRLGRWIDFRNDYKTLNTSFMESVWWVFKQLHDKGQVYRGFMIMPYSTGCTTPVSNFEANQNYKDTNDPAEILYKDPIKAKFTILEKIPGTALKGSFVVVTDGYVTDDSGTGIVHQAPAFGEDDYRVCLANNVITGEDVPCPLDPSGNFTEEVTDYKGMYIKDADKKIQKDLKARGRVSNIRERLMKNNAATLWVPDMIKERRFANWLENARDWNISRNRYWGTPIPLWISDDGEEVIAVGSVAELEELTGAKGITDLHRESIDHLTIPSKKGKGVLRRVTEVLDCWFESGSMPVAQQHYPFENQSKFKGVFPADFIAEGLDQTRGWFYTLLVLSTHLFDTAPWKNLIVNGLVLAEDGKKMSKSKRNFPDPNILLENFGADPIRLYLINSPAVRAETLRFEEKGVKALVAAVFLPWYNSYRFFFSQLSLLKKEYNYDFVYDPTDSWVPENVMDKWILAALQSLIKYTRDEMAAYRLYTVVPRLLQLIEELTNWYIRFNRRRLKGENGLEDAKSAIRTLFEVLFSLCKMMTMYQNLKTCLKSSHVTEDTRSVHFLMFPEVNPAYFNAEVERAVSTLQAVIELGRYIRDKTTKPIKTPLRELVFIHPDPVARDDALRLQTYILEELNIKKLTVTADEKSYGVRYELKPDHKVLGQRLGKAYAELRTALAGLKIEQVDEYVRTSSLTLDGVELVEGDLEILRTFNMPVSNQSVQKYEAKSQGANLVILDVAEDASLVQEGLAREVVNRVQKLRKKSGLQPTDDVLYYYGDVRGDAAGVLAASVAAQAEYLARALKAPVAGLDEKPASAHVLAQEVQEIENIKFLLVLVKA
ncbi:isoleucine--tRNA ligase, partial [Cladochytrium tenue]